MAPPGSLLPLPRNSSFPSNGVKSALKGESCRPGVGSLTVPAAVPSEAKRLVVASAFCCEKTKRFICVPYQDWLDVIGALTMSGPSRYANAIHWLCRDRPLSCNHDIVILYCYYKQRMNKPLFQ